MKHILPIFLFLLATRGVKGQNSFKAELKVFPNPLSGYFPGIDADGLVVYVTFFNLLDKKVKEF